MNDLQHIAAMLKRAQFWNQQCIAAHEARDDEQFWYANAQFLFLASEINSALGIKETRQ